MLDQGDYQLLVHSANVKGANGNALGSSDLTTHFTVVPFSSIWINPAGGFTWHDIGSVGPGYVPIV